MDHERLEHFRRILLDMRMELSSELHKITDDVKEGDSGDTMDSVDMADSSYFSDATLARVDVLNLRIKEIDEALQRIADESYGICEVCGEDIPEGRLQARPFARYCAQCKEELEKRGDVRRCSHVGDRNRLFVFFHLQSGSSQSKIVERTDARPACLCCSPDIRRIGSGCRLSPVRVERHPKDL